MKRLKLFWNSIFGKPVDRTVDEYALVTFLQATWAQKQLDDLLLMNQSVLQSLKQKPFDIGYLAKRDKIHHDINSIQPIVLDTGIACAAMLEKKYNVSFCLLSGKNRPVPKKEAPEIVLPGQEKKQSL